MPKQKSSGQIRKFRETARALETSDDEAAFDAVLRKVAKGDPRALDEMAEKLGQKDPNASFGKQKPPKG